MCAQAPMEPRNSSMGTAVVPVGSPITPPPSVPPSPESPSTVASAPSAPAPGLPSGALLGGRSPLLEVPASTAPLAAALLLRFPASPDPQARESDTPRATHSADTHRFMVD